MKKILILIFILAISLSLMGCNKTANLNSQNTLQCNDYQSFKNESWYSSLLGEITKKDKIDTEGAKWLQIISSQSNPGSTDELINKEGKIIESDMIKLCEFNKKEIIVMTRQENDLNYLFSFDLNSNKLRRVNGTMIIDESEKINIPEQKEDVIIFKTTTYGDNNDTWEKVFSYSPKDNAVYHIKNCKIENNRRDCKIIEKK